MNGYKIVYRKTDIDEQTKKIVEDYWQMEQETFTLKIAQIEERYTLPPKTVTNLVREHSYCIAFEKCPGCPSVVERKVEVRSNLKNKRAHNLWCAPCEEEQYRIALEQEQREQERSRLQRKEQLREAIENRAWLKLNDKERELLLKIIQNKTLTNIKKNLIVPNYKDKNFWRIFNKLDRVGLIDIVRNGKTIVKIEFDASLEHRMNPLAKTEVEDTSRISPAVESSEQNEIAGLFKAARLTAGIEYLSEIRISLDGSINLRIRPAPGTHPFQQTRVDEIPRSIGDILKTMYNKSSFFNREI